MEGLRIVLADSNPEVCRNLKLILSREGYLVVGEAFDGYGALRMVRNYQPDLIILGSNLTKINSLEVAEIIEEERLAPVLLLVTPCDKDWGIKVKDVLISGYLIKPISENNLLPALELTMSNYLKFLTMDKHIKNLENKLETRKVVERAKGILMDNLKISESEAFRKIQKQSMNKRKPMRSIAEAILVASDMHS